MRGVSAQVSHYLTPCGRGRRGPPRRASEESFLDGLSVELLNGFGERVGHATVPLDVVLDRGWHEVDLAAPVLPVTDHQHVVGETFPSDRTE
jgi:hypothetical protein